jgi:hypothetical protein
LSFQCLNAGQNDNFRTKVSGISAGGKGALMKPKYSVIFLTLFYLVTPPMTVRAHHATANNFDISKTIRLKGVISKLNWANPHARVWMDVKGERGGDEHWDVELASPGGIIVSGLSKDALMPGTTITVIGYPAKTNDPSDASHDPAVCATQLTLADGTTAQFVVGI